MAKIREGGDYWRARDRITVAEQFLSLVSRLLSLVVVLDPATMIVPRISPRT